MKILDNDVVALPSGHTVEKFSSKETKRLQELLPVYETPIRLQPGGWFYGENAPAIFKKVQEFDFDEGDVMTMTYPKSGTTWSQEVLWTFLKNPNFDNPDASKSIDVRAPHIEADLYLTPKKAPKLQESSSEIMRTVKAGILNGEVTEDLVFINLTKVNRSPRVIKTHLPFSLFSPNLIDKIKVLYVARDPYDVINSRFNFMKLMKFHDFQGTFDEYLDLFLEEKLFSNPYWTHLKEAWDLRNHPNLLFLKYEDMKANPLKEYEKINSFLGLNLSPNNVEKIVEHTTFNQMKKRSEEGQVDQPMSDGGRFINTDVKTSTGGFYRKGKAGDWTDKFTPKQVAKIDQWIKKCTEGFPNNFPYLIN